MADNIRISIDELRKRRNAGEDFVFIDSRNPVAWGESDVKAPGAIRVPADRVSQHLAAIPKDKPLVVYCT
jgi:rhodanese-related sulfurtransferase